MTWSSTCRRRTVLTLAVGLSTYGGHGAAGALPPPAFRPRWWLMIYGIAVSAIFGLSALGVHVVGESARPGTGPAQAAQHHAGPVAVADPWRAWPCRWSIFAEAIGPARGFATKYRYPINPDQELIGLGAANLGAGLFQGFHHRLQPVAGPAANDAAGAKSQMSGVIAAGLTVLVALFLTPLFAQLARGDAGGHRSWWPSPACSNGASCCGCTGCAGVDFALALVTFLGVLTFDEALYALLLAVVLSLVALVWRTSQGRMTELGLARGQLRFEQLGSTAADRAYRRHADLCTGGKPLLRQRRHGARPDHQPAGRQRRASDQCAAGSGADQRDRRAQRRHAARAARRSGGRRRALDAGARAPGGARPAGPRRRQRGHRRREHPRSRVGRRGGPPQQPQALTPETFLGTLGRCAATPAARS
ncbi:MAG: SulP family inorganic anion transporter [Anaerolineae bacterium]